MDKGTLHIYGQSDTHEPVYIIGDYEALRRLATAVGNAMSSMSKDIFHFRSKTDTFCADGEGYDIYVIRHDKMEEIVVPYFCACMEKGVGPKELWESKE